MMSLPTVLVLEELSVAPSVTVPWLVSLPTEKSPLARVKELAFEFLTTVREDASTAFLAVFVRVKEPAVFVSVLPTVISPRVTTASLLLSASASSTVSPPVLMVVAAAFRVPLTVVAASSTVRALTSTVLPR